MEKQIRLGEVKNILHEIFNDLFDINIDSNLADENVFSKKIGLKPRDLLYVFFEIEKRFEIEIEEESIVSDRFNTFNNILNIILYSIEQRYMYKCTAVAE